MHHSRPISRISAVIAAFSITLTASSQSPDPQPQETPGKLLPKADLVLSPEFCATRKRQSLAIRDVLRVGKAACLLLEAELAGAFDGLSRVEKVPAPGTSSSELVLFPRFVDFGATQPLLPSSQRKLAIYLEWTVQNGSGQTLWLQTVQGSAQRKRGWTSATKSLVEDAVRDMAKASAAKMAAAPELRKLIHAEGQ